MTLSWLWESKVADGAGTKRAKLRIDGVNTPQSEDAEILKALFLALQDEGARKYLLMTALRLGENERLRATTEPYVAALSHSLMTMRLDGLKLEGELIKTAQIKPEPESESFLQKLGFGKNGSQ